MDYADVGGVAQDPHIPSLVWQYLDGQLYGGFATHTLPALWYPRCKLGPASTRETPERVALWIALQLAAPPAAPGSWIE